MEVDRILTAHRVQGAHLLQVGELVGGEDRRRGLARLGHLTAQTALSLDPVVDRSVLGQGRNELPDPDSEGLDDRGRP